MTAWPEGNRAFMRHLFRLEIGWALPISSFKRRLLMQGTGLGHRRHTFFFSLFRTTWRDAGRQDVTVKWGKQALQLFVLSTVRNLEVFCASFYILKRKPRCIKKNLIYSCLYFCFFWLKIHFNNPLRSGELGADYTRNVSRLVRLYLSFLTRKLPADLDCGVMAPGI